MLTWIQPLQTTMSLASSCGTSLILKVPGLILPNSRGGGSCKKCQIVTQAFSHLGQQCLGGRGGGGIGWAAAVEGAACREAMMMRRHVVLASGVERTHTRVAQQPSSIIGSSLQEQFPVD